MVDDKTAKTIAHGRRLRAILAQPEYQPLPLSLQVALLLAVADGTLDEMPLPDIPKFRDMLAELLPRERPRIVSEINETNSLSKGSHAALSEFTCACAQAFAAGPNTSEDAQ